MNFACSGRLVINSPILMCSNESGLPSKLTFKQDLLGGGISIQDFGLNTYTFDWFNVNANYQSISYLTGQTDITLFHPSAAFRFGERIFDHIGFNLESGIEMQNFFRVVFGEYAQT